MKLFSNSYETELGSIVILYCTQLRIMHQNLFQVGDLGQQWSGGNKAAAH